MAIFLCTVVALLQIASSLSAYNEREAKYAVAYAAATQSTVGALYDWTCGECCLQTGRNVGFKMETVVNASGLLATVGYEADNQRIVIAFRAAHEIRNWLYNLKTGQVPYPHLKTGNVYEGMWEGYSDMLAGGLLDAISAAYTKYPEAKTMIVGHSLGASLAAICALELSTNYDAYKRSEANVNAEGSMTVYTFGSPRWCDEALCRQYDELVPETWKITRDHDLVPHLPPTSWGFADYGRHLHYDRDLETDEGYVLCEGNTYDVDHCEFSGHSLPDHMSYLWRSMFDCTIVSDDKAWSDSADLWYDINIDEEPQPTKTIVRSQTASQSDNSQDFPLETVLIVVAAIGWGLALILIALRMAAMCNKQPANSQQTPFHRL